MAVNALLDPERGFCMNDSIIIQVEIVVRGQLQHETSTDLEARSINANSLEFAMLSILNKQETSDVVLIVGVEEDVIYAHRCLLMARSPVFQAMLSSGMLESRSNHIVIPDMEPAVMLEILRFIYTDVPPDVNTMSTIGVDLLSAALKYQVTLLGEHCQIFLASQLNVANVVDILVYADSIGATLLRKEAISFAANYGELLESRHFQEVPEEILDELHSAVEKQRKKRIICGIKRPAFQAHRGFKGEYGYFGCTIS